MNPKYKTLDWWIIAFWFIIFGILSALIISTPPIPTINIVIVFLGLTSMIYCAAKEEHWFPEGEEE